MMPWSVGDKGCGRQGGLENPQGSNCIELRIEYGLHFAKILYKKTIRICKLKLTLRGLIRHWASLSWMQKSVAVAKESYPATSP